MGRGGFCQRSQGGSMQPAVGIGSGNVDVCGGNDEDGATRNVRQRVDFFAAADAQGAATEEKEGDVGADRGGDLNEGLLGDGRAGEAEIADQGCGGIAGTATEAAACGDFFVEGNFNAATEFGAKF